MKQSIQDYQRIEQVLKYLDKHYLGHPSLNDIAEQIGLSPFHFQRLFTRWAGVSPKRFIQFLTIQHAKKLLDNSRSTLEATYKSGLSSQSRLHNLFINCEAMTPGQYKSKGAQLNINYGVHSTPFGLGLLATTEKGICHFEFLENEKLLPNNIKQLKDSWPKASSFKENKIKTKKIIESIFYKNTHHQKLSLHLTGTNFQIKVWQALLNISEAEVVSYQNVANLIGQPKASRAVGSAIGKNSIAYLIPCHRVIQKLGSFGNYRWGPFRKKAIHAWECSKGEK